MGMSARSIKITPRYYLKLFLIVFLVVLIGALSMILLRGSDLDISGWKMILSIVMIGTLLVAMVTTIFTERNKVLLMVKKDLEETCDSIERFLLENGLEYELDTKEVFLLGRVRKFRLVESGYRIKITENITHDLYIYFQPARKLRVEGRFIEESLMRSIKGLRDING